MSTFTWCLLIVLGMFILTLTVLAALLIRIFFYANLRGGLFFPHQIHHAEID